MKTYKHLKLVSLGTDANLLSPKKSDISLSSPALDAVTRLSSQSPYLLSQRLTVDEALQVIQHTGLSSRIVVNDLGDFVGIVSKLDLLGRKVLMVATRQQISRHDVTVADVMTRRDQLHAVSFTTLREATVGDVLATMRDEGDQHLLVVNELGALKGVIFGSQLNHLPGSSHLPYKVHNFKEIVSVVHRQDEVG
ncbi:hypothetical protein HMF8227_00253 [Saliniradius amylolyticus]|uniref:CBS domain-containing protein n=1 Tax=Saliniradius amylolyticus TaxID=2183582 RepID=A0A2S2DZE2_9ALTE|nr:CBS domain-containing protein [Saliniradius amylolyticus]AWL10761.1 hypothetical protein HMF8227_00253 [Saliniradius amylolyticus]